MMSKLIKSAGIVAAVLIISACSTTTNFTATAPDTKVTVKSTTSTVAPRSETMKATSFGNYEFMVEQAGVAPMYGILPLKFNGGYLAADILFFAPAMFFNLREPFPYYEFDAEKNIVRYKKEISEPWTEISPLMSEAERAKSHFLAADQ